MTFNPWSLDYIYYPVSGIMWVWHKLFGAVLGQTNAWSWVLSVIFLVFTLRAILFKPFLKQMDSQIKMQAIQPEMKRIKEKYKDDRQRQTEELMKLNKDAGVNPLASCLPALLQLPVFIALYHVLRSFNPGQAHNYFFNATDVTSFVNANLFGGAPLAAWIREPADRLSQLHGDRTTLIAVGVPLAVIAGIMTFLSSRRSIGRQRQLNPEAASNPQSAIMNKLMLYVFPVGVFVSAFLFPLPLVILFYYMANNSWTFGQLWYSHRRQDRQKAAELQVVEEAKEAATFSRPRPGAKPTASKRPILEPTALAKGSTPDPGNGHAQTGGPSKRVQPGPPAGRKPAKAATAGQSKGASTAAASKRMAGNGATSPRTPAVDGTVSLDKSSGAPAAAAAATNGAAPVAGAATRPAPGARPAGRGGKKTARR